MVKPFFATHASSRNTESNAIEMENVDSDGNNGVIEAIEVYSWGYLL